MSVYFITSRYTGLVKIGCANDPWGRRAKLQTSSPVSLTLEAVFPGSYAQEREYHLQFAEHRVRGEWFKITPEIESLIAAAAAPVRGHEGQTSDQRKKLARLLADNTAIEAKAARATRSDEDRVEESIALHRALLADGLRDLAKLGSCSSEPMPISTRAYHPVPVHGGQFNNSFAIRPVGEHRMLCTDMGLTWDQADRLCDVLHAEKQRALRLPMPAPEEKAA